MSNIRLTQEQFLSRSHQIHGDLFDYSRAVYKNSSEKIEIICKTHGSFFQKPFKHLKGQGCPDCKYIKISQSLLLDSQNVIKKFKDVHGAKYDYSKFVYHGAVEKSEIICKIHGSFLQTPSCHSRGRGCYTCGNIKNSYQNTLSQTEVLEKFKIIHGNTYNYDKSIYTKMHSRIEIVCKIHGHFWQTPANHLSGKGCLACGTLKRAKQKTYDWNEILTKIKIIHNDRYDYSKSIYTKIKDKIEIICKIHGSFWQSTESHIGGNNCPKCVKVISKPETDWLDSLNIPKEWRNKVIKIGGQKFKPDALDKENKIAYEFLGDFWHGNPSKFPSNEINPRNKTSYGELHQRTLEKINFLEKNGYKVIYIWESDWTNNHKGKQ